MRCLEGPAVLAEADFAWELNSAHRLRLEARGERLAAWIDGRQVNVISMFIQAGFTAPPAV